MEPTPETDRQYLADRWGIDPDGSPEEWANRLESHLHRRWQNQWASRLQETPEEHELENEAASDPEDAPLLSLWREREARTAALEAQLATLRSEQEAVRRRQTTDELRRLLEAQPLQVPAAELLPLLLPVIEARYDLHFSDEGQLLVQDRDNEDAAQPAADYLPQLLGPLRLLRRSQAESAGTDEKHEPPAIAAPPSGGLPALDEARRHLLALRRPEAQA